MRDGPTIGYIALAVFVAAVILGVLALAIKSHQDWTAWCESQGGRVISDTDTLVGVGSDGSITTTTDTDYYCINKDTGGILDIR